MLGVNDVLSAFGVDTAPGFTEENKNSEPAQLRKSSDTPKKDAQKLNDTKGSCESSRFDNKHYTTVDMNKNPVNSDKSIMDVRLQRTEITPQKHRSPTPGVGSQKSIVENFTAMEPWILEPGKGSNMKIELFKIAPEIPEIIGDIDDQSPAKESIEKLILEQSQAKLNIDLKP